MNMHEFETTEALAQQLANTVAAALRSRIARDGRASLALSGGTTPTRFLELLSIQDLEWKQIIVTLVDDRWVGENSPRSNAKLLREHLFWNHAAAARFMPLVTNHETPEDARDVLEAAFQELPLPFAAVVLGMGKDGHTASFFPQGDRLAHALQPEPRRHVETMRAEGALDPRITLTLPVLLEANFLALHIEGERKYKVLQAAAKPGPVDEMPVRAVLARTPPPEIFWCP